MYSTITGTIKTPKGDNIPNALIRLTLQSTGVNGSELYAKDKTSEAYSNSQGVFSVQAWVNSESLTDSRYLFEIIESGTTIDSFYAYVPAKASCTIEEVITLSGLTGVSQAVRYNDLTAAIEQVAQQNASVNAAINEANTAANLANNWSNAAKAAAQEGEILNSKLREAVDSASGIAVIDIQPTYVKLVTIGNTYVLDSSVEIKVGNRFISIPTYKIGGINGN